MKIGLVFPALDDDPARGIVSFPPSGITMLAALVPEDVKVELVDMLARDQVDYSGSADLVGITVRTPIADAAYKIADQFRIKGIPVVLGGPHASAAPHDAALHADAVVVGEAERTWPRLVADFRNGELKKFYVQGPLRFDPGDSTSLYHDPQFPDLKELPIPRRDLLPRWRYRMDTIFTTRGCPYDCSFCPVPALFGKKPRHRPVEDVVKEVSTLKRIFFNLDDNIFGVPGDEEYYLELYSRLAELKANKIWSGQAGLGVCETQKGREILKRAVESGLASVSLGLESISEDGLTESSAGQKLSSTGDTPHIEKVLEQIRILQDHGLFVLGWFVIGWDCDNQETYERTLEFSDRAGITPVFANLYPMPGSRCYDDFLDAGRIKPDITWGDYNIVGDRIVYSHPILSEQEMVTGLKAAMKKAYSIRQMLGRSIDHTRRCPSIRSFMMATIIQRSFKRLFA